MKGIYKYVDRRSDEIIYIGKSNSSIKSRIWGHSSEEKFQPYLTDCDIYTIELPNSVEIDLLEKALINQYKPILNDIDNLEGFSGVIQINEPEWIKYENTKDEKEKDWTTISSRLGIEAAQYLYDYAYTNRKTVRETLEKMIFNFIEAYESDPENEPLVRGKEII